MSELDKEIQGWAARLKKELDTALSTHDLLSKEIEKLTKVYASLSGGMQVKGKGKGRSAKAVAKALAGGKSLRRSPDQLKEDAKKLVAFVSGFKDGVSGQEIHKSFKVKPGQSIRQFVEQYAGVKLKVQGQKSAMKYFANK